MLCDGRWADAIIAFEPNTGTAGERFVLATSRSAMKPRWRFGQMPAVYTKARNASKRTRLDATFCICVDGDTRAVAHYTICGTQNHRFMRLLIDVPTAHRDDGLDIALLMRCTAIARRSGLRYVVIEDVDMNGMKLARLASADLVFTKTGCQGWIEINPSNEN
jgi:hypothetical protein